MSLTHLNFPPLATGNKTEQIVTHIRDFIAAGTLRAGNQLMPTRELAAELGVARGTVVTAIEILVAEGLLISRTGSGTFVSDDCHLSSYTTSEPMFYPEPAYAIEPDVEDAVDMPFNFQACRPSMEAFPRMAWRKAAAQAASAIPASDYGDPRGDLALREQIVAYLQRARGLTAQADEIIVTNGAIQAMQILAQIYLRSEDQMAFEEPGYPLARQVFANTGAEIVAVGVDDDGLQVDALPVDGGRIKLVYVTPSHQFPTGTRLSLSRRAKLLEWAGRHNALILEDDYDGEFRYDIPPLPPLAAMCAKNHVVYLGTFSKTLFPSLRLGYAVAPKAVINAMAAYRTLADYETNQLTQLTLKSFIETGEFEKHIQRMRRIYGKKRHCLQQVIADTDFPGELTGINSGMNGLVRLSTPMTATAIAELAEQHGISLTPESRYCSQVPAQDDGLVLGYSALTAEQIQQGVNKLAALIR